MLCACSCSSIVAVLVYWKLYLLSPSADPFSRGPFVIRLGETSAELRVDAAGERARAARRDRSGRDDGRRATAAGSRGLEPGVRYLWTASVGGVGRAAGSFRTAPRDLPSPVTFAVIGDYGSGTRPRVGGRAHARGRAARLRRHRRGQQLPGRGAGAARPQHLPAPARRHARGAAVRHAGRARPVLQRRRGGHPRAAPAGQRRPLHGRLRPGPARPARARRRARRRSPTRAASWPGRGRSCASSCCTGPCSRATRS